MQPSSDEVVSLFPARLPTKVQKALEDHEVTADEKNVIIRHVVDRLYTEGKDSNAWLKKTAKKMPQKWSPFKNPLTDDTVREVFLLQLCINFSCKIHFTLSMIIVLYLE